MSWHEVVSEVYGIPRPGNEMVDMCRAAIDPAVAVEAVPSFKMSCRIGLNNAEIRPLTAEEKLMQIDIGLQHLGVDPPDVAHTKTRAPEVGDQLVEFTEAVRYSGLQIDEPALGGSSVKELQRLTSPPPSAASTAA